MHSFNEYLVHGNPWLFFPIAVFLGVLHGLEPGHSKTMMTAFIIGIRGTVSQAFLLGISSTISHTALIWVLAFVGLHYSSSLNMGAIEPYFQLISGVIIVGLACWMFYQIRRAQKEAHHHEHDHHHDGHHHHDEHEPEGDIEFGDAHERAHAAEVQKHLMNKKITTGQIILFGLTGGLNPCPSAFAILLLCLQLKKIALGLWLVLGFSIGLAITLVSVGIIAALSVQHIGKRFNRFGEFARKAPYVSSAVLIFIGLFVTIRALCHLMVK